jgi:hypothetical protein
METIIHANTILDGNNVYVNCCIQLLGTQRLFQCDQSERQQSVNDLQSYTFGNQLVGLTSHSKVNVLVGVKGKKTNYMLVATS